MGNKLHLSNFIDRLKCLRGERYGTQQKLADAMKVDLKTVRNWENAKLDPPACAGMKLTHFINLCEKLECDPEYLIGDLTTPHRKIAEIRDETALSEKAIENIIVISKHQKDPVYDLQRELIDAMLEDEHFLHDTARLLLSYFSIPDNASCHMSFTDCSDSQLEADYPIFDNTDELKKLFRVNLQNTIYKFLEKQFKI